MDDFDNYSSNNSSEQNFQNSDSVSKSVNSNEMAAGIDQPSVQIESDNLGGNPTGNITQDNASVNNTQNNWNNIPPMNNGSFNNSFGTQTPPPYYYSQTPTQNPQNNSYSNGNSFNNSNPYPYANRPVVEEQNPANGNQNRNSGKNTSKIIIGVVIGLIFILIVAVILIVKSSDTTVSSKEDITTVVESATNSDVEEAVTQATPSSTESKKSDELTAKEVYNKISDASVGVIVYENSSNTESGEGSGVLLKEDKNGKYTYIITCAHVISGANKAVVQLSDNTEYQADIIGADSRTDIGVLRIEAHGLTLAEIGDSESINVGDSVYAIGNPGGTSFAGSFTDGMISALDRPVNSETGYTMKCIQHTAAINPGNSGGALVNAYGQLVGINSSKIVSEDYEGMGFSVPSSVFVEIFNSIVANGYVVNRAKLGITYVAASEYSSYYGMYVALKGLPSGALVVYSISSDSDLANTEVQKGDLIVSVNGKDLDDSSILAEAVENGSVGDTLTLGIVRINENYECEEFEVNVKLVADKDGSSSTTEETTTQEYSMEDYFRQYFGDSYGSGSGDNYGYGSGSSNGDNFGW